MFRILYEFGNDCIATLSSIAYQLFSTIFYLTSIENSGTNLLFRKEKNRIQGYYSFGMLKY